MSKDVKNLEHAEAAPIEELEELKAFWSKYGHYICIVLLVVLIFMIGKNWFVKKQVANIVAAQEELNTARTPEEFAVVVDNNRSSYVTPIAMLRLGAAYYADGRYDEAIVTYEDFLAKFDSHILADNAKFALATVQEVTGKFDAAIANYSELEKAGAFKQDAILGKARCLILKGDKIGGKGLLDLFIADNAGKPIVIRAEALISAIDRLQNPAPKSAADLSNFFAAPTAEAVAPEVTEPAAE
ncbi:MAG: tetratricopeptide repeat protein [Kiritimatiellae bacterium]|nr:tetratricopeptide repeat protein [Kiritimatiellia bacterium]